MATRMMPIRRASRAVACAIVLFALASAPIVDAASSGSPFTGSWVSTDLDGSAQALQVSSGDIVRLVYTDSAAPATCAGAPVIFFSSTLTGTVDANVLEAAIQSAHCGPKALPDLAGYPVEFSYDSQSDSLFGIGVTWIRVAAGT